MAHLDLLPTPLQASPTLENPNTPMVAQAISQGDLTAIITLLFTQASALNALFTALAAKVMAPGDNPRQLEKDARLALRAQSQSRITLQSLATILNRHNKQQTNKSQTKPQAAPANPPKTTTQKTTAIAPQNPPRQATPTPTPTLEQGLQALINASLIPPSTHKKLLRNAPLLIQHHQALLQPDFRI